MYFGLFDPTVVLLIPAIIFAFYAQAKVNSAYNKYSGVRNKKGINGAQAARQILDANKLGNVRIEVTQGKLSDHYDPRTKILRLSPKVYNEPSIASVSIAAHECGHAVQHANAYAPLIVRNSIVPVVNIVSTISWPLLIFGLIIGQAGNATQGNFIFNLGIIAFLGVVLFHLITLPVELNASSRAIKQIQELNIIYAEEASAAKKVLSAAAMTYVAALAMAVANLLRLLAIRGRN